MPDKRGSTGNDGFKQRSLLDMFPKKGQHASPMTYTQSFNEQENTEELTPSLLQLPQKSSKTSPVATTSTFLHAPSPIASPVLAATASQSHSPSPITISSDKPISSRASSPLPTHTIRSKRKRSHGRSPGPIELSEQGEGSSPSLAIDLSSSSSPYLGSQSDPIDLVSSPPVSSPGATGNEEEVEILQSKPSASEDLRDNSDLPSSQQISIPVVIEVSPASSPVKPKAVYSIFNRQSSKATHESSSSIGPTNVLISPQPSQPTTTSKPSHPFFAPRPPLLTSTAKQIVDPPRFTSETYHITGPQTEFYASERCAIGTRSRRTFPTPEPWVIPRFPKSLISIPHSSLSVRTAQETIASESHFQPISDELKASHPVLSHLMDVGNRHFFEPHALWTHRWRPTQASHVLGNEDNALYLRDWLKVQELELDARGVAQSPVKKHARAKRKQAKQSAAPKIVRAVVKKNGRKRQRIDTDDEDDWIVHSDDSIEFQSDDESIAPTHSIRRFHPLTNTILLHGPNGSGKTAAVYACAEELGWDVFEVYPGIGRRNGSNLDHLVGEVGKNHIVGRTQLYRTADVTATPNVARTNSDALTSLLRNGAAKTHPKPSGDAIDQTCSATSSNADFGFLYSDDSESLGTSTGLTVRQSLILLEEVDILFKDDQNFWPSVVSFIQDCKRPVICTCNDLSLVPVQDLPLQTTLTFSLPNAELAATYLQIICQLERQPVSELDKVLRKGNRECDIRQALHQLQSYEHNPFMKDIYELDALPEWDSGDSQNAHQQPLPANDIRYIQFLSDVYGAVSDHGVLEETPEEASFEDDEVGHTIIRDHPNTLQRAWHTCPGDVDRDVLVTAVGNAHRVFRRGQAGSDAVEREMSESRSEHMEHLKYLAFNSAFPERFKATINSEFHLDYLPHIRQLVAGDDAQDPLLAEDRFRSITGEQQPLLRLRRGLRPTRRNHGYVRTVELNGEERSTLEKTALKNEIVGSRGDVTAM